MVAAAASLAVVAGCGSDPERRAATAPDDSVVLGTDPVPTPTETARKPAKPKPKAEPEARPQAPDPTTAAREPGRVTVIGDSLAVGTQTLLPAALPGWSVSTDARKGRPLAEGMQVLRGADVPAGSVLVFSLFTNDTPSATGALEAALRAAAEKVGPQGCQVWATIARPVPGGGGEPANRILRDLDGGQVSGTKVVVADWADLVSQRPALLAPDGVHGTPEGYRLRARLYADAVRRC
ncbi:MAG TPA: hypothetical protein VFY44_01670 [Thermoleophilaceae bacterium]|nr:hypothetical protein [Thermoleophilaceae bacterium]